MPGLDRARVHRRCHADRLGSHQIQLQIALSLEVSVNAGKGRAQALARIDPGLALAAPVFRRGRVYFIPRFPCLRIGGRLIRNLRGLDGRHGQLHFWLGFAVFSYRRIDDSAHMQRRIGFPGGTHPLGLAVESRWSKASTEQVARWRPGSKQ